MLELESQRLQKRKRESCTELLVSLTAKLILAKGMKPGVRRVAAPRGRVERLGRMESLG